MQKNNKIALYIFQKGNNTLQLQDIDSDFYFWKNSTCKFPCQWQFHISLNGVSPNVAAITTSFWAVKELVTFGAAY